MTAIPLKLRAITFTALAGSALAWIALARADVPMLMDAPLTMGLDVTIFLALWLAMMLATMLPSMMPMVRAFARAREGRDGAGLHLAVFVSAYFVVWTALGAIAYAAGAALESLASSVPAIAERASVAAGLVLVVAGAYQLSPVKAVCLSGCRSPMGFLLAQWRDGTRGALEMGLRHAALCVGCCWLLFAALFPVGTMNLAAMALLAGLILVEKTLPAGARIGQAAGVALFAYGIAVLVDPSLLPASSTAM